MQLSSISNYAQNVDTQQRLTGLRLQLDTASNEAVTGLVSDTARAVGGDIGQVAELQNALEYSKTRVSVLGNAQARAEVAQNALGSIQSQANAVLAGARLAVSAPTTQTTGTASESAFAAIEDIMSQLNTSYADRPVFGGDESRIPFGSPTDLILELRDINTTPPADVNTTLSALDTFFDDPAGGFMTDYYQGGDGDAPQVELSEGVRISTAPRGDSDEIRDTLKALAIVALASERPNNSLEDRDTMMARGAESLSRANDGVLGLQASLGLTEQRIAEAKAGNESRAATLERGLNTMIGTDQAEAATRMRLLESQLEASYLTTSRMASLSILNYLR